jgi:hypothetical protein
MPTPKKPTQSLSIMSVHDRKKKGVVGAACQQDDGSFYVTLNAGVVLSWKDDITIRLFPLTGRSEAEEEG